MRTLILSDIHLGSRHCNQYLVNEALDREVFDRLILNGDTIHNVNLRKLTKPHWQILDRLRKIGRDKELILIRGNHDHEFDHFPGKADRELDTSSVLPALLEAPMREDYRSTSLLGVARNRIETRKWDNVAAHHADATTFALSEKVDVVTFSYSLTMIPDWYLALENARRLLKPNGWIGVVDFYVARKYPAAGHRSHGWMSRTFWPTWFGHDNVYPSPDHVPYLHQHFMPVHFEEQRARVPFIPFMTTPYYTFIGRNQKCG